MSKKEQVIKWAKQYNPNIEKYKITERKSRYGKIKNK